MDEFTPAHAGANSAPSDEFAEALKEWRIALGLTRPQACRVLASFSVNVSVTKLEAWENARFKHSDARSCVTALNISVYLLHIEPAYRHAWQRHRSNHAKLCGPNSSSPVTPLPSSTRSNTLCLNLKDQGTYFVPLSAVSCGKLYLQVALCRDLLYSARERSLFKVWPIL